MKISFPRREVSGGVARLSVDVVWEDAGRPARTLTVETEDSMAPALSLELDGWAIACAVAAQHHGERRILVAGTLCPVVADGLRSALMLLRQWYGTPGELLRIEPEGGFAPRLPPAPPRAAVFFSGGVDSLFSVVRNRDRYPPTHPDFFRDAIVVDGYCFAPAAIETPRARDYWTRTESATRGFADSAGLRWIPVRTNLRCLDEDFKFFGERFHAAMLVSIGHLLGREIAAVAIAAGLDVSHLRPWGSHPLLDRLFSGTALAVSHDGFETLRRAKIERLASSSNALAALIVCNEGPLSSPHLNCGRCEKCLRTLVALVATGADPRSASFATATVEPADLEAIDVGPHPWAVERFWRELVIPLRARGKSDLAAAAERVGDRAARVRHWQADRGWKGALRRFDRRCLGGRMLRARRRWTGRDAPPRPV